MNIPEEGTNQLLKAGFDWIALKVIFQGRKGLNLSLFSNFATYCPFIQNLFSNFFSILAWSYFGMKRDTWASRLSITLERALEWKKIYLLSGFELATRDQKSNILPLDYYTRLMENAQLRYFWVVL